VRAVNLANNHILDCGETGLQDTRAHLSGAGIAFAGAGTSAEAALRPALITLGRLKIGLLGFTDNLPAWAAGPRTAGTNFLALADTELQDSRLKRGIAELRVVGAQLIVLSLHWGPNLRSWPSARFRAFARRAIALGIDVVHGHSAHLVQGIERCGRGLVLYDTGDFLNDYWVFPGVRIDRSFSFFLDLDEARPQRLRLVPVKLTPGRVSLARGSEFEAICRTMQRRSLILGTKLRANPQGLELSLQA
jgi:poly-gamma-glutamate synthesis protein (capsule biosynthesis protein)